MDVTEALVMGGGGIGGIAWVTGLLAGLADRGEDVTGAALILGTSAGATVGAQLGSGLELEDLYARQVDPDRQATEIASDADLWTLGARLVASTRNAQGADDVRRAIGTLALETSTVPEAERRAAIASRLPSTDWPDRTLKIVAVDAHSGAPVVFDRTSGVSLLDAVTASCAVPGIWPPATIGDRRYVDGGVRSSTNADLAAGASRVLVIAPLGLHEPLPTEFPVAESLRRLRASGAEVALIAPDEASSEAVGMRPLDPETRAPAARAGREQGRRQTIAWS